MFRSMTEEKQIRTSWGIKEKAIGYVQTEVLAIFSSENSLQLRCAVILFYQCYASHWTRTTIKEHFEKYGYKRRPTFRTLSSPSLARECTGSFPPRSGPTSSCRDVRAASRKAEWVWAPRVDGRRGPFRQSVVEHKCHFWIECHHSRFTTHRFSSEKYSDSWDYALHLHCKIRAVHCQEKAIHCSSRRYNNLQTIVSLQQGILWES